MLELEAVSCLVDGECVGDTYIAFDLLESIHLLTAVSRNFELRCIAGLEADATRATSFVEQSLAMATSLAPVIGYDKAAKIAKNVSQPTRKPAIG